MPPTNDISSAPPPFCGAKGKLRPPIYPRPVSPVPIVECPLLPGQKVFLELDNGIEGESTARAAKRRKIENAANAVLRGEPVFIMTATLKGPFGKGWKNPWAKKRQPQIPETTVRRRLGEVEKKVEEEAPETHEKVVKRLALGEPTGHEQRKRSRVEQTAPIPLLNGHTDPFVPSADYIKFKELEDVKLDGRSGNPAEEMREDAYNGPVKVEDWLRSSKDLRRPDIHLEDISPTPSIIRTNHTRDLTAPRPPRQPRLEPSIEFGSKVDRRGSDSSRSRMKSYRRLLEQASTQGSPPRPTTAQSEPMQPPPADVPNVQAERSKSHEEMCLANTVLPNLKVLTKTMATHIEPASTQLSAFEYRRLSPGPLARAEVQSATTKRDLPGAENTLEAMEAGQKHTMAEQTIHLSDVVEHAQAVADIGNQHSGDTDHPEAYETAAPSLVSDTSKDDTTSGLPSAQHPSKQQPPPSSSNLLDGVSLPEPQPELGVNEENREAHKDSPVNIGDQAEASVMGPPQLEQKDVKDMVEQCLNAECERKPDMRAIEEKSTQQVLAEMSPFVISTIKKPITNGVPITESPVTATKAQPSKTSKTSKKASFATRGSPSGSSQGSIKSALRVSKAASSPIARPVSPCADKPAPLRLPAPAAGKGILKSSMSAPKSSAISSRDSSAVMRREGQQDLLQQQDLFRGVFEHSDAMESQGFDLEGAISDLGSFLVAFDPEKEASRLASAES